MRAHLYDQLPKDKDMNRFIEDYQGKEFDLLVVGGGITGASIAYEGASRGLKVALVEKTDFASATSSATSKMIHGGLRYLGNYDFALVRESLRERRILMNIAPNYIHPTPFLFSSYKRDKVSFTQMKIGMLLYEAFSYDKNRIWDQSKSMPSYQTLKAPAVIQKFPHALTKDLIGGQLYYDCTSHSPERFTLSFIKSAIKHGAAIANYTEVKDFIFERKGRKKFVHGVKAYDRIHKKTFGIHAKLVINCTGPWADILLDKIKEKGMNHELRRSEGIHFIIGKNIGDTAYSGYSENGRHFFLLPYRNHTLIGTTDKEFIGKPEDYKVTKKAITELLKEVNSAYGRHEKIRYEDILHAYGGLRPLVEDQTEESYKSSRKYEITGEKKNGISGLITVEGGKFTTSRMLAEKAINKAIRILKKPKVKSFSMNTYLVGCEIKNEREYTLRKQRQYAQYTPHEIRYMVRSYGTEIDQVLSIANRNPGLNIRLNKDGELLAQVVFAVREEMAMTLSDIIFRRTGIGLLGHPGLDVLNKVAQIAAQELAWDQEKMRAEIELVQQKLKIPH